MKTCVHCGHKNYEGTILCDSCHKPVVKQSTPGDTLPINPFNGAVDRPTFLLSQSVESLTLMVYTEQSTSLIPIPHGKRFILGRLDYDSEVRPDIDLTIAGAKEMGVSRQHAAIEHTDDVLTLTDLDSRNGTYLNRKRLLPHKASILHHGDEIRLGRLMMVILFE